MKDGAMMNAAAQAREVISFGPFSLVEGQRLLTKGGEPVELGARALDILVALLSHPNEIVGKKELLARVWPDVIVEESSLRYHIAGLRRVLGDGKDGARYIATMAGRGYCFVAPVSRASDSSAVVTIAAASLPYAHLPGRLARMVGRNDVVVALSAQLELARFVSIVGAGGIGKTTVAIAVAHHVIEAFEGAVLFVDLGMLSDPDLVGAAVASMLGLSVFSSDATPSLLAYLRDKRILIILDTCEHLIEPVAALASAIFEVAPQVHILATSREALQVEGEHVYKLGHLAYPPDDPTLTAEDAQAFPATQLFLERALASGAQLEFGEAETAIACSICRKLDGVALAIELAARRVESHGLEQTAQLLDQRLELLWPGPRTAPPRQKTLQATLDWSYELLSDAERVVLRRLAIFVGHFTLDAALAVVASDVADQSLVFGAIDGLVAKSMVAVRPIGAMMRYRLLDTTRAYAQKISLPDAELAALAVRHATYYQQWMEQTGTDWPTLSTGAERAPHFAALNNARAALEWCFGQNGNPEVGVRLAVSAAPVFLAMSLLVECHRWSGQALDALDDNNRGGTEEMHLQAALGVSLMFTHGGRHAAGAALERGLAIAEAHDSALDQLRMLGPLSMYHLRTGSFRTALSSAKRCSAIAGIVEDPLAAVSAHAILGISLQLSGDLEHARTQLKAALTREPQSRRTTTIYLGFEGKNLAGAVLARNLWLQGHPGRAVERVRETVKDAAAMHHSLTLSIALIWGISVFFWTGDLQSAEEHIDWLMSHGDSYSLAPYGAVGRGFMGELAIRRGDATGGVQILEESLERLHAMPYELLTTEFNMSLAKGLSAVGRLADGMALIEETMRRVETNGDLVYMPELLRVKAGLLLSMSAAQADEAERHLMKSLELARSQGARGWELRTVTNLAALFGTQGRSESGNMLLRPVLAQFVEGHDTADVKAAEHVVADFGHVVKLRPYHS